MLALLSNAVLAAVVTHAPLNAFTSQTGTGTGGGVGLGFGVGVGYGLLDFEQALAINITKTKSNRFFKWFRLVFMIVLFG